MLPIFNNYTWIAILLVVMAYVLKDWRDFNKFSVYMKVLHVSSFITGICVIDVLAGKPYLSTIVPNYIYNLLPLSLLVSLLCLFKNTVEEIKNSEKSESDKNKEYRKRIIIPALKIILTSIALYNIEHLSPIVERILFFAGFGK